MRRALIERISLAMARNARRIFETCFLAEYTVADLKMKVAGRQGISEDRFESVDEHQYTSAIRSSSLKGTSKNALRGIFRDAKRKRGFRFASFFKRLGA